MSNTGTFLVSINTQNAERTFMTKLMTIPEHFRSVELILSVSDAQSFQFNSMQVAGDL